jgi:diguanylate cyclase (GGDEF)-like protein
MATLDIPPMLWLVAFQLLLYALAWVLCGVLLGKERTAVVHWGGFLLLTGVTMLLAGGRTEAREWWFYNGSNIASLIAFATMRRGSELFMRLKPADFEQALVLVLVCGAVGALGPQLEHGSWRIVLTYGGQGYIMLRTMGRIARPMRSEFGPGTLWAIVVPGMLIGLMIVSLAAKQVFDFAHPMEMQRNTGANYGLMYYYLGGAALFNFGFMVLLTQRLVVALREASQRDALSGLYNRRAMNEELERQWQRYLRNRRPFALLLLDIDHFKRINDSHGHAVGDQVLVHVAHMLQSHARATDTVARMGGEEFLLLLPEMSDAEALRLAERLRATLQTQPLRTSSGALLATTASIGVATVDPADHAVDPVVVRADDALYRAKAGGRNRCEVAVAPAPLNRGRSAASPG